MSIDLRGDRCLYDAPGAVWNRRSESRWMTEGCENLRAIDKSGSGTAEIRAGIDGKDSALLNGRQAKPIRVSRQSIQFSHGTLDGKAARHKDQDIRRGGRQLFPRDALGLSACSAQKVSPSCP